MVLQSFKNHIKDLVNSHLYPEGHLSDSDFDEIVEFANENLLTKDIKKKDLSEKAGISPATITKMGKGGHVTTEVLVKICSALNCKVEDVMEIVDDTPAAQ